MCRYLLTVDAMLSGMRLSRNAVAVAAVLALPLAACGGGSSKAPKAAPATSASLTRTPFPGFSIPSQTLPFDPCKLSSAQVSGVVGFPVVRQPKRVPDQCEYSSAPGGQVSIRVDSSSTINISRDKADETFSLGGRYITFVDETVFPKGGFTAVKNPGDKSPGVIADAVVYLDPGHIVLRIYYPQGGRQPGRAHALALVRALIG
jgi:hypothetical protein